MDFPTFTEAAEWNDSEILKKITPKNDKKIEIFRACRELTAEKDIKYD